MNYNYNPNGYIPNGRPYYPSTPPNPFIIRDMQKKTDKKTLRKMGNLFGLATILYLVFSVIVTLILQIIFGRFINIEFFWTNSIGYSCLSVISSVFYLGGAFAIVHFTMRGMKISPHLPLGTTYNGKAATCLVMIVTPLLMFCTIVINWISVAFQNLSGIKFSSSMDDTPKLQNGFEFFLSFIAIAVTPAIIEELALRGVVLQPLRRYGDKFAIVVSAMIFSLLHGNMEQIPYTFTAGLMLGYVAIATGSLWPGIIIHFINNAISTAIVGAADLFGERASNFTAIGCCACLFIVFLIGILKYVKLNYKAEFKKGVKTLSTTEKFGAVFLTPLMIIAILIMIWETSTYISS